MGRGCDSHQDDGNGSDEEKEDSEYVLREHQQDLPMEWQEGLRERKKNKE